MEGGYKGCFPDPIVEYRAGSGTAAAARRASATADKRTDAALEREGGTAILRGQFPRARQLYRQATYADPGHAGAWRGLGLASERMGLAPEAANAYQRYLRLAPSASGAAQVRERLARLQ